MVNFSPITAIGAYTGILPSQQMWAYDMYPSWTPASIAYPSDSLSIQNDKKLYQFDVQSDALVRQAAMLEANLAPMAQQWQAQVAQWYNNTMQSLNSNMSWNFNNVSTNPGLDFRNNGFGLSNGVGNNPWMPGMNTGNVNNNNNNNSKEMDDKDVWKYMSRTGTIDTYGEKLLEKVKLKDGTEKSYVERLVELAKDFVTAEDTELSDSEFAQLKEIATKLRDNKPITKEDFLTLKEIVKNHRGEIDGKKDNTDKVDDDDVEENENETTKTNRSGLYNAGHYDANGVNVSTANDYYEALDSAGTDKDLLKQAGNQTTKYNVIEVLDQFEIKNDYQENLLEAILDDCDNWNGSNEKNWHWFEDDSARAFVQPLCEKVIERCKDLRALSNCSKELKAELEKAEKDLKSSLDALNAKSNGKDHSDDDTSTLTSTLSRNFSTLVALIKSSEEALYNEQEYNPVAVSTPQ